MNAKQILINDLPISPVDPHSPIPLYHQIYLDLKRLVQGEVLTPGSLLPPELEICHAYGVGRQTVRMAIARLVSENLVERYAGRGTFIKSSSERMKFYLDRSFTQQMLELGYQPHSKILNIKSGTVDSAYPEALHKYAGAACLDLIRLRYGNDEPVSIQATTVLTELCPDLADHDFTRSSLYDILAREYRLVITEIRHLVRAVPADKRQSELLQVLAGSPLLFVDTTALLEDKRVIECTRSYYRGDRYEYSTTHICCD